MNGSFDAFSSFSDASSSFASLSKLLSEPDASNKQPSSKPSLSDAFNPGSIGPPKKKANVADAKKKTQTKDIWEEEEILEDTADVDPRPCPEYDISYRQKVGSEDMFLGMGGKIPSFGHCDELVVTIQLPGTSLKDIELSVEENVLDLRCAKFRLKTSLPTKVNEKNGNAKWDGAKSTITISLPIVPEFPL